MKYVIISFCFLVFGHIGFSQFTMNDTTFFVREAGKLNGYDYYYHAIYFNRNKNAEEYNWIADFKIDSTDKFYGVHEYLREINRIKRVWKSKLKKVAIKNLPRKWCMLYKLKDSFYVYSPSEYCNNFQREITDSVFIDKGCERTFSILDTVIKRKSNFYQLKMKSIRNLPVERFIRTVNIYIIDKEKGIAIFEDDYFGKKQYKLMIDTSKIRSFPLIVNDCKTEKQNEFEFDKVDYQKLINESSHKTSSLPKP